MPGFQPVPTKRQASAAPSFVVCRAVKGTAHTFQVYFDARRAYFIRVGGGPGEGVVLAHGGLIGALIGLAYSSHSKKKQQQRVEENQRKTPEQMLADHKANHAIDIADITDIAIESAGWKYAKGSTEWQFNVRGEKNRVKAMLKTPADIAAAISMLPTRFADITVNVHPDAKSGKYLKNPAQ